MSTGKNTPRNILKQRRSKKKVTLDNLSEIASSDNVSDAMKNLYGKTGLIDDVKPLDNSFKAVGRIKTAYTDSNDWGTSISAIYNTNPGEILFIQCSDDEYAVWGGLASAASKKRGLVATVIYGTSRDTDDIVNMNYPVFSRNIKSHAGKPLNNGYLNDHLVIKGNVVSNDDIAICDRDGVVVIPKEKVDKVLEEVGNIKKFENDCVKKLEEDNLDNILEIK